MLITEDHFYVCLLSNNSLDIYPNNVLSAFTNKLHVPITFTDSWSVGITEIGFNNVQSPQSKLSQEHIPTKKAKRNVTFEQVIINIEGEKKYRIEFTSNDLNKLSKSKFISFSTFLENMHHYVVSNEKKFDHTKACRKIKEIMFQQISKINLDDIKYEKVQRHQSEFSFKINLSNHKDDIKNITLKYKTYESIETFLKSILSQIPKSVKLEQNDLKLLFNIFYSEYDMLAKVNVKAPTNSLKITFSEFNTSIEIGKTLIQQTFKDLSNLDKLLIFFSQNLKVAPNLSITDYLKLKDNIKFSIIEALRGDNFTGTKITKTESENTFSINIPIAKTSDYKFEMQKVIVEIKHYDRMQKFLQQIILQIPEEKRNVDVLIEYLEVNFAIIRRRQIPQTDDIIFTKIDGREAVIVPYHLRHLSPPTKNTLILPAPDEVGTSLFHIPKGIIDTIIEPIVNQQDPVKPVPTSQTQCNIMKYMYVYTDIIKPRFIGKDKSRFLRLIPIFDHEKRVRFDHVEYCPLEKTYIDSISILITDGYSKRINFIDSYLPTYIMLHFRKNSINMG